MVPKLSYFAETSPCPISQNKYFFELYFYFMKDQKKPIYRKLNRFQL